MIDPTTPDERPDLTDDSQEDFDRRLAKMYPDVDWTEADKDFLRASGLI